MIAYFQDGYTLRVSRPAYQRLREIIANATDFRHDLLAGRQCDTDKLIEDVRQEFGDTIADRLTGIREMNFTSGAAGDGTGKKVAVVVIKRVCYHDPFSGTEITRDVLLSDDAQYAFEHEGVRYTRVGVVE